MLDYFVIKKVSLEVCYLDCERIENELKDRLNNYESFTEAKDNLYDELEESMYEGLDSDYDLWEYAQNVYDIYDFNYDSMMSDILDLLYESIRLEVEFY